MGCLRWKRPPRLTVALFSQSLLTSFDRPIPACQVWPVSGSHVLLWFSKTAHMFFYSTRKHSTASRRHDGTQRWVYLELLLMWFIFVFVWTESLWLCSICDFFYLFFFVYLRVSSLYYCPGKHPKRWDAPVWKTELVAMHFERVLTRKTILSFLKAYKIPLRVMN